MEEAGQGCRNYALAALKIMQPSFRRLAEKFGVANDNAPTERRKRLPKVKPVMKPVEPPAAVNDKPQEEEKQQVKETKTIKRSARAAKRRGGGWVSRW